MKRLHKLPTQGRRVILLGMAAMLVMLPILNASAESTPNETERLSTWASFNTSVNSSEELVLDASTTTQIRTVTYTYDDAGRLVGADYGKGQDISYSYDAAGNLLGREVYGVPTPTPTATASPTATPTPTNTPTPTSGPTVTPTATVIVKLYLPSLLKGR